VSPDSALGQLAQRITRLEQRVEDTLERMAEKFGEINEAFRMFHPIPLEQAAIRANIEHLSQDLRDSQKELASAVGEFRTGIQQLAERWDGEMAATQKAREEREERERRDAVERSITDRRDRWARLGTICALTLTAVALVANVIEALVT
jgi:hypothetical protein